MARRLEETRGTLIFQEGKEIEGEYYIIAVYDDAETCAISFSAYELETDCTYTYPLTYSEFDNLFKYDSELMNPSNQDGRFHWVIRRLDFVRNVKGVKVLCFAQEPTPEDEEDDAVEDQAPKPKGISVPQGGKVDAATRVKLLKELDTQDDHKLHVQLVKSEDARTRFISKLQSQRLLQIEKASQRLLKADEEREARLIKLEIIKKQQAEKKKELEEKAAAQASTQEQLKLLMRRKEAQAIRRIIQQKDEQDRGAGKEKHASRNKRKQQERSEKEVAKIEAERAKQQARKREDQVIKREVKIKERNFQIAERVHDIRDVERETQARIDEQRDELLDSIWRQKAEERRELMKKRDEFEAMEQIRERWELDRERRRAHLERDQFRAMREADMKEREETRTARLAQRNEKMLQWKVDASARALAKREQERRTSAREKKISEYEEVRLRRFRETQFLESTMRHQTLSPERLATEGDTLQPGSPGAPLGSTDAELAEFKKCHDQQERARRHAERAEKRKQEEAKRMKLTQLTGPDPNARELANIQKWREEDHALKKKMEAARLQRELHNEKTRKEANDRHAEREELWKHTDKKRRDRSTDKAKVRLQAVLQRVKTMPVGTGLPNVLLF